MNPIIEKLVEFFQLSGVETIVSFLGQSYFELSERCDNLNLEIYIMQLFHIHVEKLLKVLDLPLCEKVASHFSLMESRKH